MGGKHKMVELKLTFQQLEQLHTSYYEIWQGWESENDHDLLLYGHVRDMMDKLWVMVVREQRNYTFTMGATEGSRLHRCGTRGRCLTISQLLLTRFWNV